MSDLHNGRLDQETIWSAQASERDVCVWHKEIRWADKGGKVFVNIPTYTRTPTDCYKVHIFYIAGNTQTDKRKTCYATGIN